MPTTNDSRCRAITRRKQRVRSRRALLVAGAAALVGSSLTIPAWADTGSPWSPGGTTAPTSVSPKHAAGEERAPQPTATTTPAAPTTSTPSPGSVPTRPSPDGSRPASVPALAAMAVDNNEDGRLEAFWNDNGTIMHAYQTAPNSGWSAQVPLNGPVPSPVAGDPLVQLDSYGQLAVVVDTTAGTYSANQVAPNSAWSDWQLIAPDLHRPALMQQLGPIACPVVPVDSDFQTTDCSRMSGPLDVFYGNAVSGLMMHQTAGTPGFWHAPEPRISDPFPGQGPYHVVAFNRGDVFSGEPVFAYANASTAAVCYRPPFSADYGCATVGAPPGGFAPSASLSAGVNADGRAEVYAFGADNGVWHVYELPGGTWTEWEAMFRPFTGVTLVGSPQAQQNTSGSLELVMAADDGSIWHTFQYSPNGSWFRWDKLGQSGFVGSQSVALAVNEDGRLEEFNVKPGPGAKVTHAYQAAASTGPWSSIIPL